ncbi:MULTISPECIES: STAS domain-containing protein [Pedobacter]|uniref:Sulfate transporter/antisigma-factor antagonist STAS n=1 Tax=Pedobacter heparinus (strain ATCC 13125 / DSM 2366 / CIP 104194 / JCM 7457 / NBRC 12017 / NCIMB 9290 / NRRL B-14731 / HIM 762-3) TaxID=485917 RepID=C6XVZ4_PEDHD|nr:MULTISPECIES: STAS domain-containing protein [Pedobacter]ACU04073.1 Sulfate transporter/antisigma-factor antagonist STAS [Pedobacter heparinus DSM 2366]MBB5436474.1 anti-anti-sigma factor [Pedobacter sp. AK017]
MKFSVDKHEKYVVLKLNESKLTNDNTPKLKSEFILLNTEGYCNIVLDLSSVKQCDDSQDLSSLLFGDRLCKKANGLFIVTGINEVVAKILEMSSLDQSLTIVSKIDEATDLIFMEEIEKELLGSVDKD